MGLYYTIEDPDGTVIEKPDIEIPLPPVKELLVPLTGVQVEATLEGSLATVDFQMSYINPGNNPIECTYEFPLDGETLLSELTIYIEDKVIEAIVLEKEEAKQVYEEVIADGDLGVYVER
jgi:Ca-activated chloride channel family protein